MNPRLLELQRLTIAITAETDDAKRQALLEERAVVATAELDEVRKQEAVAATLAKTRAPARYPQGLEAQLGEVTAKVTVARYDHVAKCWRYAIELAPVPLLGTYTFEGTEDEVKTQLAERLGQAVGPAYPVGVTMRRGERGGLVEEASLVDGEWVYLINGQRWTEQALALELAKG